MKKLLSFIMVFILGIGLIGCSSTKEDKTYDEDFIKSLSKALESRWDINDKYADREIVLGSDDEYNYYSQLVDAELNQVSKYKDLKFEDSKLQELALQYINLLNQQKESLEYLKVDYEKYDKEWMEAYDKRGQLIIEFVDNYGLTVSSKHQDSLKELITNGTLVNKEEDLKEEIDKIINNAEFNQVKQEYEWGYYEAVLENITDEDFEYFTIEINLLDKEGVVLESTSAYVDNWIHNQKAKFEFMTDKDFETMTFSTDYLVKED